MIHVSDKNSIAISTPVAGTYTWLRADGSARKPLARLKVGYPCDPDDP